VKSRNQPPQMLNDNDTSVVYRGPFVVLVNGYSASASEIFAAAIQDYKRGVIMGSTTYGKGTVQQVFNLDDYVSASFKDLKPLGSVKISISKFYRINGGSTQLDGVTPDIQVPDPYEYLYVKEKASEYPLNWDKIPAANYQPWGNMPDRPKVQMSTSLPSWNSPPDIDKLRSAAEGSMAQDSSIELMKAEALQYKKQKDNSAYPLNLADYRKQQKEQTENNKKFEGISKVIPAMKVLPTTHESARMAADTNEAKSENQWLKPLTKDAELYEATRVIDNMK
jgi:carboxyl-terminal processing protease